MSSHHVEPRTNYTCVHIIIWFENTALFVQEVSTNEYSSHNHAHLVCIIIACTWMEISLPKLIHMSFAARRIVHAQILCSHFLHKIYCTKIRALILFGFASSCDGNVTNYMLLILTLQDCLSNAHVVGEVK